MRLEPGSPHEGCAFSRSRPQGDAGRLHGGDDLTEGDVTPRFSRASFA